MLGTTLSLRTGSPTVALTHDIGPAEISTGL
jgi:hypothetical protein